MYRCTGRATLTVPIDVGKFLNEYSQANYQFAPKGWDHVDALVCGRSRADGNQVQPVNKQIEPYINDYNNVVMSQNGERPIQYRGFHSTDVVRVKA